MACGCTLDGFHDCDPARKWAAGLRNAALYCSQRRHGWQRLTDVVSLTVPSSHDRSQS
jgi:hypothetical protein